MVRKLIPKRAAASALAADLFTLSRDQGFVSSRADAGDDSLNVNFLMCLGQRAEDVTGREH